MNAAAIAPSIQVTVVHGRLNVAWTLNNGEAWALASSASPRGVAEIVAGKALGCESHEVALHMKESGDSASRRPSIFEATKKGKR